MNIEEVSKCTLCRYLSADYVPAFGDPYSPLMVVGQSPGRTEVTQEEPFVGPSGVMLDNMLAEVPLSRTECYITNALKCHPSGNRKGFPDEIRNCRKQWLSKEIKIVDPKIILLLGKDAYLSVLPKEAQKKLPFGHGAAHKFRQRIVVTSYHPSYFLRRAAPGEFSKVGTLLRQLLETITEEV